MKVFIFILIGVLFSTVSSFADTWCQWDELTSKGINCKSDSKGYIMADNFPTSTPALRNAKGWYIKIDTEPEDYDSTSQIKTDEVWGFANNEISKTWNVRDLTTTELDQREASMMNEDVYWLWKALHGAEVLTTEQITNNLPQEQQDAFLARNRLNP